MMSAAQRQGYSTEVRLELRVNGKVFDIARVGPNSFVPREPMELDVCDAEVAMFVDGELFLWPVRLPHGVCPFEKNVKTIALGEMQRLGRRPLTLAD
jgi:hypothetical protein